MKMNRRKLLSLFLALPFVPSVLRAAQKSPNPTSGYIQTTNTNPTISIVMENTSTGWIELKGDAAGGIEYVLKPSKDCLWICRNQDGTHVSFIGPLDIGPAELEERKRLAMESKKP